MSSQRSHELTIEELREILRLPNHLIAIIKPDGTFYKVNEETSPVLGWDPDEVIGKNSRDFIHPDDWEETFAQMTSAFLGSKSVVEDMRNRIRTKDGTWRWISWTGKAKGGLIYAHGSDVTEKIAYEEALTVQALVLESISEGVTICNEKGLIVFANTAAEKLYGYETEELIGKNISDLCGVNKVLQGIKRDEVWQGEFENTRKDGTNFSSACRITLLDLHGEIHYVFVQRDISKKIRLTREREELETRFRAFFEQSPLGMVIFDLEGRALEINRSWEEIFQVSRSALDGFRLFSDPFAIAMGHIPYIERAIAGEVVMIPPFFIDPQPKGTVPGARPRWLEVWFSPVKGPDGATRELACTLKDITDEVETKNSLIQLESKLSLSLKVGKVGIWEWIPRDDKIIWDVTTLEIFGYTTGSNLLDAAFVISHFHPEDKDRCMGVIEDALASARPYLMDYRIVRKDGVTRWVQGAGMPFYDSDGKLLRVLGTVIDITDRKEQEEDQKFIADISEILSSSFDYEKNIQTVLNFAVSKYFDGGVVDEYNRLEAKRIGASSKISEDKKILLELHHLNKVMLSQEFLNYLADSKEILISDVEAFLREGNFSPAYIEQTRKLNIKESFLITLFGKNGPVGIVAFHLRRENKDTMTGRMKLIAREIGYRISLALENSLLYHNSQEAIRARDEFLSIASHELKTPLQSLTLQNQMRKRMIEKKSDEAVSSTSLLRTLEMDKRQLSRINRLIDDMLDISRIKNSKLSLQKEKFNISGLVEDVSERLRPQFEAAGCSLQKNIAGLAEIVADSYRIEQVLVNILINAMKYGAGAPVTITLRANSDRVFVEVTDNGPGIREEDRERIFHRFERAVPSQEVSGLGLGLYIAREIMELHGGLISVRSTPGEGSTFIMELPL